MQNAPARGRTLLLKYIVIEAMVTYFAVLNNNRYGWVSQSLLPGTGGNSLCSIGGPGRTSRPSSNEPPGGVRDDVLRAGTATRVEISLVSHFSQPDCMSPVSGRTSLKGVQLFQLWLVPLVGNIRQSYSYHVSAGQAGT